MKFFEGMDFKLIKELMENYSKMVLKVLTNKRLIKMSHKVQMNINLLLLKIKEKIKVFYENEMF